MFEKILIANRGEIACRVIRTARRMGIATVAVWSDADAGALHVRMADEAVRIGPAPSAESYLDGEAIIRACRETGAQAVHPGYGFLSENPGFARALASAGIAFIGPGAEAIAAMGDKIESKRLAAAAGVSTVPGHPGVLADLDAALAAARAIGWPVMVKASAGGGGKGMRIARDEAELREGFALATSEARTAFGDDRVFVEKFVEQPRHIEIQVLADSHGNIVHLGERECSIQRRHQKVIEEAPSPFLDAATREAMGAQAVALARSVGYRSAGTVEFIVDGARNFYFLEMNTRLQVEHPVTEGVTGLDLVELMIRIAAGEPLPFTQAAVRLQGWAMEARLYAEDPWRGFLPSVGRLTAYRPPPERGGVRIDTGVVEGAEISIWYDPMIAKLVTTGPDRAGAIAAMADALNRFQIAGVGHNVDFLCAVMRHPRFAEGRLTTGFIEEEYPDGFAGAPLTAAARGRLHAVAVCFARAAAARDAQIGAAMDGARPAPPAAWVVREGDAATAATIEPAEGGHDVTLEDGARHAVRGPADGAAGLFDGMVDGQPMAVWVQRDGLALILRHNGAVLRLLVLSPLASALLDRMPVKQPPDLSRYLLAPMPGLLVRVSVAEGETVKAGQELAVVEAMKMENVMRAERDGTIARIHASDGDSLSVDQPIIEFA